VARPPQSVTCVRCRIILWWIKAPAAPARALPGVRWSSGRVTGTMTLRAALAGRARSRPGHTASISGRCAATADSAHKQITSGTPRMQRSLRLAWVSVPAHVLEYEMAALLGQLRRFPGVVRALRRGCQLGGRWGTELGPTGVARGRLRIYRGGVEGASGHDPVGASGCVPVSAASFGSSCASLFTRRLCSRSRCRVYCGYWGRRRNRGKGAGRGQRAARGPVRRARVAKLVRQRCSSL
jgi:hypothetical protein